MTLYDSIANEGKLPQQWTYGISSFAARVAYLTPSEHGGTSAPCRSLYFIDVALMQDVGMLELALKCAQTRVD